MGMVLTPNEWYKEKLKQCPNLNTNSTKTVKLKEFIDFLEKKGLYMSVLNHGRTTKNSSIYNANSTDSGDWICSVIFFEDNDFIDDIEVICKMSMNTAGEIYENDKFIKILEINTGISREKGKYSDIKTLVKLNGFEKAIDDIEKAISIYKIFN